MNHPEVLFRVVEIKTSGRLEPYRRVVGLYSRYSYATKKARSMRSSGCKILLEYAYTNWRTIDKERWE